MAEENPSLSREEEDVVLNFAPEEDAPPVPLKEVPDEPAEEPQTISLVDDAEVVERSVKAFGAGSKAATQRDAQYKRELNVSGQGATRCRIFHSRIAVQPLEYMEKQINTWLDNENVEVKHVGHTIGVMEGKLPEPNLIVTVWF